MLPVPDAVPAPYLSVIIPVYNRAKLVQRAIASVLNDSADDIEVIVIDDGSTDGSADVVAEIRDPRCKLLRLQQNAGQCSARNRGAAIATGAWLVFLDSDDELVPGALSAIRQRAQNAPASVGKLIFACRDDLGAVSPQPALDGRTVDYIGYVKWLEETSTGKSETLPTTRRAEFLICPYPESRIGMEGIHELDFAAQHKVWMCPEVVRLYHYDAINRVLVPDLSMLVARASSIARNTETMLSRHGEAIRHYAPTRWTAALREASLYNLLSGNRSRGVKQALQAWMSSPFNPKAAALVACSWLPSRALARLKVRWSSVA